MPPYASVRLSTVVGGDIARGSVGVVTQKGRCLDRNDKLKTAEELALTRSFVTATEQLLSTPHLPQQSISKLPARELVTFNLWVERFEPLAALTKEKRRFLAV